MKKNYWIPIMCMVLVLGLLVALFIVEESGRTDDGIRVVRETEETLPETAPAETVEDAFPTFEEEVLLCSDAAKQLYDHEIEVEIAIQTDAPYRSFAIVYDVGGNVGTFLLSEDKAMTNAVEYTMDAFSTVLRIDNLKTGTTYYYRANIGEREFTGSFTTAASTRFLSIPGIVNTRDIGGYVNQDGKAVRQGLLIRGTEIDGLENPSFLIPEESLAQVQETFGFVYDFDLRSSKIYKGDYQSPLGDGVGHTFYAAPQYDQIFESAWQSHVRDIFTDLADPAKYPMYLHCTWGKDRTGTIVFLLQGVLNMSREDMLREYLLSGFVYSDITEDNSIHEMISGLEAYRGETLQEKIVDYLTTDVGVTQEELESIRQIFLEN